MNLTVQVKLLPDDRQVQLLTQTLVTFNDACNYVSLIAFEHKMYKAITLHHLSINNTTLYYHLRAKYPQLISMHTELIFRKVADAYKTKLAQRKGKFKKPCQFNKMSAVPYNGHTSNHYNLVKTIANKELVPKLSLSLLNGRDKINYTLGDHQRKILANSVPITYANEARLVFRKGNFYLNIPVEQCVAYPIEHKQYIGVDLGIANIATTSQGKIYSSNVIEAKRIKFQKHRSSLQKCGTKSAKRRLKKVSGKEQRFRKDINHCISKALVAAAEGTASGLVLEDLTHIRSQITVRKQQRVRHHGWSFKQLRSFITYKALMIGVAVKLVNPKYTSQRCNNCGCIEKKHRKSQFKFHCDQCNYDAHADYNAALNLAWLGNNDLNSFC